MMSGARFVAAAGSVLLLAACGGNTGVTNPSTGGPGVPTPPAASLTGAGATFPAPFYDAARFAYNQKFSQVTINYQSIGSGAGIQQGEATRSSRSRPRWARNRWPTTCPACRTVS